MTEHPPIPVPDDEQKSQEIFRDGFEKLEKEIPDNTMDISGEAFEK